MRTPFYYNIFNIYLGNTSSFSVNNTKSVNYKSFFNGHLRRFEECKKPHIIKSLKSRFYNVFFTALSATFGGTTATFGVNKKNLSITNLELAKYKSFFNGHLRRFEECKKPHAIKPLKSRFYNSFFTVLSATFGGSENNVYVNNLKPIYCGDNSMRYLRRFEEMKMCKI